MKVNEEDRQMVAELNNFIKTLDENIREAAFNFLLGRGRSVEVSTPLVSAPVTAAGAEREISPQELIRQSSASSAMAKAEILGYWLEAHRGKTSFASGDLKEAFSQAREPAPRNMSDVVAKLASSGKLMPTEKVGKVQYYRLTQTSVDEVRTSLKSK